MLKKYFSNFLDGFQTIRLYKEESIQILILGVLLIILYFIFGLFLKHFLKISYLINEKRRKFSLERLNIIIKAIKSVSKYILLAVFILFVLNKFNVNLTVILTGAGFLGATIVLIFQNTLRDVFTGWILFFEDLFREGERVMINNAFTGRIIDFKSRFLVLRGDKGEIISLPYSQINTVHNFSRKRAISRLILRFKREYLNEEIFKSLDDLLKINFPDPHYAEFNINRNFTLYENSFEILLTLKAPLNLKDEINYKIKNTLLEKFADSILEIKNEA